MRAKKPDYGATIDTPLAVTMTKKQWGQWVILSKEVLDKDKKALKSIGKDVRLLMHSSMKQLTVAWKMNTWGRPVDEHETNVPLDWWEHFKERWFPSWAKSRWPVKKRVIVWQRWQHYPKLNIRGNKEHFYNVEVKP